MAPTMGIGAVTGGTVQTVFRPSADCRVGVDGRPLTLALTTVTELPCPFDFAYVAKRLIASTLLLFFGEGGLDRSRQVSPGLPNTLLSHFSPFQKTGNENVEPIQRPSHHIGCAGGVLHGNHASLPRRPCLSLEAVMAKTPRDNY